MPRRRPGPRAAKRASLTRSAVGRVRVPLGAARRRPPRVPGDDPGPPPARPPARLTARWWHGPRSGREAEATASRRTPARQPEPTRRGGSRTVLRIDFLALFDELRAMAGTGLTYATDLYDRERYQHLFELAAAGYAAALSLPRRRCGPGWPPTSGT